METTIELKKFVIEEQAAVTVECLNNTYGATALFFGKTNDFGTYSVYATANTNKLHGKSEYICWLNAMQGMIAAMNLIGTKKFIEIYLEQKGGG